MDTTTKGNEMTRITYTKRGFVQRIVFIEAVGQKALMIADMQRKSGEQMRVEAVAR